MVLNGALTCTLSTCRGMYKLTSMSLQHLQRLPCFFFGVSLLSFASYFAEAKNLLSSATKPSDTHITPTTLSHLSSCALLSG
eukprot:m.50139 g.50139  ORF g.50139 m.50139 type:complete len:82 (-) comp11136_c0_seq1:269-514(-)